jgi:class 3 adenylate cyclase
MAVYKIGRSPKSDVVLTDPSVSRDHAELSDAKDGRYHVIDVGSSFGTFIMRAGEWRKIQQAVLAADEPVMFGKFRTTPAQMLSKRVEPPPTDTKDMNAPRKAPPFTEVSSSSVVRRLAAILAADVVGYSRMMGENESGTLNALKAMRRDVFDPTVGRFRGRIFKVIGDGILTEFQSVVDAVRCAVEIQAAMHERAFGNAAMPMRFRMGINLGDVMVVGDDLYGDGVNIAARLETLAPPGGLCVSGPVYDQVKNKLTLEYEDLGEQNVKNIAEPLRVYRIQSTESGRKIVA